MAASATAQAGYSSSPGGVSNWIRQGFESFVAAQKILLDLTAQQNALAIRVIRERMKTPALKIGPTIMGVATQTVAGVTGAAKIMLDLAASETALLSDGLKDVLRLGPTTGTVADVVRYRTEAFIDMQRKLLDAVAEQMDSVASSYHESGSLAAGASATELARRAIEVFVQTEKRFLNLVAEEVTRAAEGGKETRKTVRDRSKLLANLAREGVDKYIEAQKQLFDLAIKQVEAGPKVFAAHDEHPDGEKEPPTSLAELTEKSVKNFIAAEKLILDLAIKPVKAAAAGTEAPPRKKKKKAARASA